jgi:hypothetical protein
MNNFFETGLILGLLIGVSHAVYLYRLVAHGPDRNRSGSGLAAINFAVWSGVLWVLLGTYLLGYLLIAFTFYIVFKVFR